MRHFRPRFTVRTLAIGITLVCVYFAAWVATKRYGLPDQRLTAVKLQALNGQIATNDRLSSGSPAPFIIWIEQFGVTNTGRYRLVSRRHYRLWFFGHEYPLFESEPEDIPLFGK